jgi:hypothetical protein
VPTSNLADTFEVVASGQAVVIVPASIGVLRPDLTLVPIEDIEPSRVVLATRAGNKRLLAAFTKYAQAHGTGPARVTNDLGPAVGTRDRRN